MAVNFSLLNEKIRLEAKWNQEYSETGYSTSLVTLEKEIKEIKKKMIFEEHDTARREIKQPAPNFAHAS